MDIHKHADIIEKWLLSCETEEQIELLGQVVAEFIVDRFSGKYVMYPKVGDIEMGMIVDDLFRKMADKIIVLKRMSYPENQTSVTK